jgi:hypothetical protein
MGSPDQRQMALMQRSHGWNQRQSLAGGTESSDCTT